MNLLQRLIAEAISMKGGEYDYHDDWNHAPAALQELAGVLSRLLGRHDPSFNPDAFLKACEAKP